MLHAQTTIMFPSKTDLENQLASTLKRWDLSALNSPETSPVLVVAQAIKQFSSIFSKPGPLRVEYDHRVRPHPHATIHEGVVEERHYYTALVDLLVAKRLGAMELNFHIPVEVGFSRYRDLQKGALFMRFVDTVGAALGISTVWENAPILAPPQWSLVENVDFIPPNHALCLDTGHLMLGAASKIDALARIDRFLEQHGAMLQHLHLHINDFVRDRHINDPAEVIAFLGFERFKALVNGRSYIFERGF